MSERPTPEEIAEFVDQATGLYVAEQFLDRLETEGYRIVHPDDVPERPRHLGEPDGYHAEQLGEFRGWNDCRAHIFGEGA